MSWQYGKLFSNASDFLNWLKGQLSAHITEVHVHHTYSPSHKHFTGSNHRFLQDGMRNFHVHSRGFQDIAQHITIYPDGKIMTGRNVNIPPASATNHNDSDSDNRHPFMFEMIGNFDKGYDKLEGKQLQSAVEVTRFFHNKGAGIKFHNEMSSKTCPGSGVSKSWFVDLVKQGGAVVMATAEDMYDLSIAKEYRLVGLRSSKHTEEIDESVSKMMLAHANCLVLTKRGFDLRILYETLKKELGEE